MTKDQDLFGKTFDQQLAVAGESIAVRDIAPNRRIPAEIIFEPMGNGVRVTARDGNHKVLWGYVGSKETVKKTHCLVATYDTLQDLIAEELEKRGLWQAEDAHPMKAAQDAIAALETTVQWLKAGLAVKKTSDATLERAKEIGRMARDANRQLTLEGSMLKGMKSKAEPSEPGDS
ncbi:MAG TPA: hypothetical protein PLT37_11090 [Kiritimatiellia bacterium]|jgi:hypothetical protein|nr:hypothetical protein [Kiritimatiellia bacterium]HQF21769.1 hypothetical protein [Kiritimatiellia bacterium]HQG74034.1 hypothetical protein [Kiritimatiellia bacterium]HXK80024.1 hypothetical protein [Kiritimatiellia bacterium]